MLFLKKVLKKCLVNLKVTTRIRIQIVCNIISHLMVWSMRDLIHLFGITSITTILDSLKPQISIICSIINLL